MCFLVMVNGLRICCEYVMHDSESDFAANCRNPLK